MTRIAAILGLVFSTFIAYADADYSLMKDVLGTYPVLSRNGNFVVAGMAEIFADNHGVGFKLSPMKMSTHPVPQIEVSSAKATTDLKRSGNQIEQTYVEGPKQLKVYYVIEDGYLLVDSTQCDGHACVSDNSMALSTGKSPGDVIAAKDFFLKIRGNYAIDSVGGAAPHPESNTAEVAATEDPNVEQMRMPYCQPKGCDPGYLDMPLTSTLVYKNGDVYTLLQKTPTKLLHYTWAQGSNGMFTLTNYQYKLFTKEIVSLEHILHKIN